LRDLAYDDFPEERASRRRGQSAAPSASAPPRGAPKPRPSVLARVFAPRRMAMVLLLGIMCLAFVGVPMNALFLQDGRHPAPLFAAHAPPAPVIEEETETPAAHARTQAEPPRVAAEPARASKAAARAANGLDSVAIKDLLKSDAPAPAARAEKKREPAGRESINALLATEKPAPVVRASSVVRAPVAAKQAAPAPAKPAAVAKTPTPKVAAASAPAAPPAAAPKPAPPKPAAAKAPAAPKSVATPARSELDAKIAKVLAPKPAAQ
jgi:hypothetical protein